MNKLGIFNFWIMGGYDLYVALDSDWMCELALHSFCILGALSSGELPTIALVTHHVPDL